MKSKLIPRKENGNVDWKLLIIGKDWMVFFLWLMIMLLVFAYMHDTKECKKMMENIDEICTEWNSQQRLNYFNNDLGGVINETTWEDPQYGIPYNLSEDS